MATPTKLITHPLYAMFAETWRKALDVFEGAGGFLDEERPYLIPHPREWLDHSIKDATTGKWVPNPTPTQASPKLKMRRKLARYENVSAAIMETVTGALFQQAPARTFEQPNERIAEWWENVDGKGNPIDVFMHDSFIAAGVFGHVAIVVDKPSEAASTQADAAMPVLCRYTPQDIVDWLTDEYGNVTAVKLIEPAPRESFDTRVTALDYRVRVIDEKEWALYDKSGAKIDGDAHGFTRLPVILLYGKRRPNIPVIGKSIIGDPELHIDLYNLVSEVRELLRNQTFGILNVPVGKDGNAETEMALMGSQSGTANVLFSTSPAAYISPEGTNVEVYHEHIDRLVRMIYRLASCPWESDSKDAEAMGSLQLKRQDMQNTLMKYAGELQRADNLALELAYEALFGLQAERQMETDGVSVAYPDEFEVPDFEVVAKAAQAVMALEPGETAVREIKRRVTFAYLNDLTPEQRDAISAEIDAIEVLTEQDKQQQLLDAAAQRLSKPVAA